jgi:hypothetical protein
MKIKESVVTIDLTFDEAWDSLKLYQADMLHELAACALGNSPTALARSQFMLNLLKHDEDSDWFQDLIEENGILWITTPSCNIAMIDLIEQFPHLFGIGEIIEKYETNSSNEGNFDVRVDGVKLDCKIILHNI